MKVPWLDRLPPRRRKQFLWVVGLMFFYTVFGFLILPPIVRSIAVKQASKALQREVSIEKVKLNPYALSATVRGLLVKDKDGEPFVSWDEVYANFQLSSIFSGGWDFKEFRLKSPYARVQINKDGTLNFSDLLVSTNAPAAKTNKKPRPLRGGAMRLTNVVLSFTDFTHRTPFYNKAGTVELLVDRFSTASDNENPYSFAGTSADGESFSWKGSFSLEPLRSQGDLSIGGMTLKKYKPYHEDMVRFDIRDGTADVAASYQVALGGKTNVLRITNASVTLKGLKIAEKGAETNVVEIPLTLLSGAHCDLFARIAELKQFSTKDAWFDVRRAKDGRLNLVDLFTPLTATNVTTTNMPVAAAAPATNSTPWRANIGTIYLRDYAFSFEDQTTLRPVRLEVDKLTLAVTNVSNQPGTNTTVDLSLRWNTNGTIKTVGTVAMFPPSGELEINLDGIQLLPLDRYLDHFLNLTIHGGSLALKGVAKFAMPSNGPVGASFSGNFHLADFAAKEVPEAVDFAKWRGLALRGIDLQLGPPIVAVVDELALDKPFFRIARDSKTNNLAAVLRQRSAATNAADATARGKAISAAIDYATSAPPIVIINGLAISNGVIQFSDLANARPVQLLIEDLGLRLKNVSNQPGTNTDVALALRFNTNGTIKTEGTVGLLPPTADLKLNLDGIALHPLDPYLDSLVNLFITRGALGIDGRAKVSLPTNGPMAATFQGDVRLLDFATVDGVLNEEFVKWNDLNLRGLNFHLDPMVMTLREVGVNDLLLRFVLGKDTNNVAGLVKKRAASGAGEPKPASASVTATSEPKINITSLVLSNANLEFKDTSITPTTLLSVRQLTGTIGDLSSERVGSSTLDLKGKVDNAAPFEIAGKISLLTHEKNSDIKLRFKDVEMAPMAPYIAKFLGYRLTRGRFNVNVQTLIQGRKIDGKNLVVFDQFTLGESVPGTNAVKAPIKLALAILKDSEGKIELDLPVQGDLDDPNYRYGKILWRAIRNVFLKAATSPFALLGAAFGGKGEELSFQDFDFGLAELKPENAAKLDTVAKALQNRPALSLDISGSFDPAADGEALRREKPMQELRAKKFEEQRAAGQTAVAPEEIELAPEAYTIAVVLAYASTFSTNTTNSATATNLLTLIPALTNRLQSAASAPTIREAPPPAKEPPAAPSPPAPSRRGAAGLLTLPARPSAPAPARVETKKPAPATTPSLAAVLSATNVAAITAAVPFAEMEKKLLENVVVTDSDLSLLAAERARKVKDYLLEKGQIAPERLFIAEHAATESSTNRASRVFLQLK